MPSNVFVHLFFEFVFLKSFIRVLTSLFLKDLAFDMYLLFKVRKRPSIVPRLCSLLSSEVGV